MRWPLLAAAIVLTACGIDALGTMTGGGSDGTLPDGATPGDGDGGPGTPGADGASDAPTDTTTPTIPAPSHVPVAIDPNAPDLEDVVSIDTTARTIKRVGGAAPPAGLRFEDQNGRAVLFVGKLRVVAKLDVTGNAPLVVLASKDIDVEALIEASAQTLKPGPGGSAPGAGTGKGANAVPSGTDDPGGGGAGFGTNGAKGGDGAGVQGGAAGVSYGALVTDFFGGSGGGNGSPYDISPCTAADGRGGAGGGAVQLTSAGRIHIHANGVINAGGGGGGGGCLNGSSYTMSGGGGGSGGTIFLEAPGIEVEGALAANGGGGGGGAANNEGVRGENGENGKPSTSAALGGPGATDRQGGAGGTKNAQPARPSTVLANNGGGGGAVGRIWLRTRGTAASILGGSVISPAPSTDTSL